MCGIWGILGPFKLTIPSPAELFEHLKARGPDYTNLVVVKPDAFVLGFTRLAMNGLTQAGNQPFVHESKLTVCDDRVYNYIELAKNWNIALPQDIRDCSVLSYLASRLDMTALCRTLDGEFAFLHADTSNDILYVARDPYGVRPLFYGSFLEPGAKQMTHIWSSEIKGLSPLCTTVEAFPPGTWRSYKLSTGKLLESQVYHSHPYVKLAAFSDKINNGRINSAAALRCALITAVKKRLMLTDGLIGAILNGTVENSIVAAIAAKELAKEGKELHTFSIGVPGSCELEFAEKVAKHIKSVHHVVFIKPEDLLKAIPKVIKAIESYDVTTVRTAVKHWAIGKFIRECTSIKAVLSGDGSDEIGGGYAYFNAAPSNEEFEMESDRLVNEIHLFGSAQSMSAHGLESVMPMLDKNVVATWKAIDTAFRRPVKGTYVEKQILYDAFKEGDYLPEDICTHDELLVEEDSWNSLCAEHAKSFGITMSQIETLTAGYDNPPASEEAFYYRRLFEESYGAAAAKVIPCARKPHWADT